MNLYKTILVFITLFIFTAPVFAADPPKFSVSYDISYTVAETGTTTVNQSVHLVNLTSEFYASEYTSIIGNAQIKNVRAYDRLGPINIETSKNGEDREIHIAFNDKVYGQGRVLNWTLIYDTNDIAQKHGRVWEINIPGPSPSENIDQYNITLSVPVSFGDPLYVKPKPPSRYFWTKDQIKNSGISLAFGDYQLYRFSLTYRLANQKLYPQTQEILLPPDTQYQKIYLENLTPKPANVILDGDGNWLAKYSLSPQQKLTISARGYAVLSLKPLKPPADFSPQNYLYPQRYWEANDPEIARKSRELQTPDKIYEFVKDYLHYDFQRADKNLGRLGAKGALVNPQSTICMEFTDLFIALSRAAGIPARQLSGYAYAQNDRRTPSSLSKNTLHAWPEYFDGQNWVMVDPTWGNTTGGIDYFNTFDLNHLVLAINGEDPLKPVPPQKDLDIVAENMDLPQSPSQIFLTNNLPESLTLTNSGQTMETTPAIDLSSESLSISPATIPPINLPPFATKTIPITLKSNHWLGRKEGIIKLNYNGKISETKILIRPVFEQAFLPVLIASLVTFGFIIKKKVLK